MSEGALAPAATRPRRLWRYLRAMFPLERVGVLYAAHALAVYLGLQAIEGRGPVRLTWRGGVGTLAVMLALLLMRVFDDLKDADHDRALAAAGDARFTRRPVVMGSVTLEDLASLRAALTVVLLGLSVALGLVPLAAFAAALVVAWMSSRWFFWPAMATRPLVGLATHLPVYLLLVEGCMGAVYVGDFGTAGLGRGSVLLCAGLWLGWGVVDSMRKVRMPAEETAFRSYSSLLGWRIACLAAILWTLASLACMLGAGWTSQLPGSALVLVAIAAAVAAAGPAARLLWPPSRAQLMPFGVLYITLTWAGTPIAIAVARGLSLS